MTRPARLRTPQSEIQELKDRVYALERKIRGAQTDSKPDLPPEIIVVHYRDLSTDVSDPYRPQRRSRLATVACCLADAGSSSTVVSIKKNGSELTTVTLASSDTYETKNIGTRFAVGVDEYTIAPTSLGTGAAGLVVIAVFV